MKTNHAKMRRDLLLVSSPTVIFLGAPPAVACVVCVHA